MKFPLVTSFLQLIAIMFGVAAWGVDIWPGILFLVCAFILLVFANLLQQGVK